MGAGLPRHAIELGDKDKRIRELEQQLSKTIHERDLALRSADKYRQRMRGWQDGAVESANTFVCHTEELAQENAKLHAELAEIEATTVPSGQYLDVVARYDKLHAEFERGKLPDGFPKIICLCGSSRFISELAITGWELEKKGYIALGLHLLPRRYTDLPDHLAEAQGVKETMDELHKRKIDLADEVLILNIGGYIGESTRSELEYARAHGKPVRFIEPEAE